MAKILKFKFIYKGVWTLFRAYYVRLMYLLIGDSFYCLNKYQYIII